MPLAECLYHYVLATLPRPRRHQMQLGRRIGAIGQHWMAALAAQRRKAAETRRCRGSTPPARPAPTVP